MVQVQPPQPVMLKRPIYSDSRGSFSEVFSAKTLKHFDFNTDLQINYSKSARGVTRGLHFQKEPQSQAKLITCVQGEILDVLLDLSSNPLAPTLHYFELSAHGGEILYVPKGFAHSFQALADETEILYAVNRSYSPEFEVVIDALDKDLKIAWKYSPLLSDKDKVGASFAHWVDLNRKA